MSGAVSTKHGIYIYFNPEKNTVLQCTPRSGLGRDDK